MESQNKQIRAYLESGKSITPLEALHYFGCLRLGVRIYELIHEQGLPVKSELVEVGGKRVARYSLPVAQE